MHAVFLRSVRRFLVTANVPSSPILVTLMMEAIRSFETLALTRATRRNIPEGAILHSHRREHLKSYIPILPCYLPYLFIIFHSYMGAGVLRPVGRANINHWTQHSRCLPPIT
jgi:hypothetical protein